MAESHKNLWQTEREITEARLALLSPEAAYKEIVDYGAYLNGNYVSGNSDLEESLLKRDDKLINLGLAQFGTSNKVVLPLFRSSCEPANIQSDPLYFDALRLACLSNANQERDYEWEPEKTKSHEFFRQLLQLDEMYGGKKEGFSIWESLAAREQARKRGFSGGFYELLSNPAISGRFLESLYAKSGIFKDIREDEWFRFVRMTTHNPRLNIRKDSEAGPDMGYLDIQRGIRIFLETAPTDNPLSIYVAYELLSVLSPILHHHKSENPETVQAILNRWRNAPHLDNNGKEYESHRQRTSLSLYEELLCLIAILYGRYYDSKKSKQGKKYHGDIIGKASDSDIALRCAFYGNGRMSTWDMKLAHKKDGSTFAWAALYNPGFYWNKKKRIILEDSLAGDEMWRLYAECCCQMKEKNKHLDLSPISEWGGGMFQEISSASSNSDTALLKNVVQQNDSLKQRLDKYEKNGWVIVIIAIAYYLFRQ